MLTNNIKKDIFIKKYDKVLEDDYFIQNRNIGSGAYGQVFKGFKINPKGQSRAIKIIDKKVINDDQMLRNEMEIMKQMDHPNILKLYEIYEYKDKFALITELCEGRDLFDELIQRKIYSEQEAQILFTQMVQAQNYMHKKHICHRDIKPENYLFLTKEKNSPLILIDFGFAKNYESQEIMNSKLGTCFYIAPEVLQGHYTEKCDTWSLGIILFVFIFGFHPFDGESNEEIFEKVLKQDFKQNCKNYYKTSAEFQDLIQKLLVKNPDKRLSCQQILNHPWMKIYKKKDSKSLGLQFAKCFDFKKQNKLKQIVLKQIASQLQAKEINKYGVLFKQLDKNQDGVLTKSDLLLSQDLNQSYEFNRKSSKKSDNDQNIDFNSFMATTLQKSLYLQDDVLKKAFNYFDEQNKGSINQKNLKDLLGNENQEQQDAIWGQMIQSSDLNNDGVVDFQEFKTIMNKD